MLRPKTKSPQLFYNINVEALIPENHFLRKLDRVMNQLAIGRQLRGLYNERQGRPAMDPEMMVRILLLGYLYGLSENRLFQELKMHIGYRWFCGLEPDDPVPDRTTLNKLRNHRWGKANVVEWMLVKIVQRCIDEGLVKGKQLGVDGTQVRANASIQSFEPIEVEETVGEYLKRLSFVEKERDEGPGDEGSESRSDDGDSSQKKGGKEDRAKLGLERGHRKKRRDFRGEKLSNQTHRSRTDPDALLFRKGKGKEAHLSYLMHDVVDLHSGVVLARSVTRANGALEREAALEMLDDGLGRYGKISFEGAVIEGDKNYCTKEFIFALSQRGYLPFIAVRKDLKEQKIPTYKRPARDPVLRAKRQRKEEMARAINRFLARTRDPVRWPVVRRRKQVERVFAEAKALGMERTRFRGLRKVERQALLVACAQNLRRLISYLDRKGPKMKAAASLFRTIFPKWTHFLRKLNLIFYDFSDFELGFLNMA